MSQAMARRSASEISAWASISMAAPPALSGKPLPKSSRLAEELLAEGYTNVRRYQLDAPVWRALGGVMQLEPEGFDHIQRNDRTAVVFDARSAEEFRAGTLPGAVNLPREEVAQAKAAAGNGTAERMKARLVTGRFFMERLLPETGAHLARIQSGSASMMELPAEAF